MVKQTGISFRLGYWIEVPEYLGENMLDTIKRMSAVIRQISLYAGYTSAICAVMLIILVLAEIVRRTFFNSSFLWTFEISSWLLVAFAFLGMGYTLQSGGHVRVTLLTSRLSKRIQTWLNLLLSLISAFLFAYFTIYFFEGMVSNYEVGAVGISVLEPPVYIIWVAAVIGLSVFSLQFVGLFLDSLIEILGKEIQIDE